MEPTEDDESAPFESQKSLSFRWNFILICVVYELILALVTDLSEQLSAH